MIFARTSPCNVGSLLCFFWKSLDACPVKNVFPQYYHQLSFRGFVSFTEHRSSFVCNCHELLLGDWLQASKRQLPMLVDAERLREGLDDLLAYATYVVASSKFPQVILYAKVYCLSLLCPNCKYIFRSYERAS